MRRLEAEHKRPSQNRARELGSILSAVEALN